MKLTLLRAGSDPIDLSVVRERLVPVAPERRMLADQTGYIKLAEFSPRAADEVKSEIEALRRAGAHALILDLRGSGAGAPADGVKIAELFLKGGPLGKLAGTREAEQVFSADPARSPGIVPLAVLVDTGTGGRGGGRDGGPARRRPRSDRGRAHLRPRGRAEAGAAAEGGLLLTVAKYVSPKGTRSTARGSSPRSRSTCPTATRTSRAVGDPILDKALEVLKNPPAVKKAA